MGGERYVQEAGTAGATEELDGFREIQGHEVEEAGECEC